MKGDESSQEERRWGSRDEKKVEEGEGGEEERV